MAYTPRQIDVGNLHPHTFQTIRGNIDDIFRILNQLSQDIKNNKQQIPTTTDNVKKIQQDVVPVIVSGSGIGGIGTPNFVAQFSPDGAHVGDSNLQNVTAGVKLSNNKELDFGTTGRVYTDGNNVIFEVL